MKCLSWKISELRTLYSTFTAIGLINAAGTALVSLLFSGVDMFLRKAFSLSAKYRDVIWYNSYLLFK
jgi:hypothetical protein